MGSLGGEVANKAMWLYPKVMGFNPTERWGHSSCYSDGSIYVFGGCCGGLHFSDVIMMNLDTMAWNTLVTTGHGPGPRDSHSAVLVGHRMIVFGGTNGSKKVNDLHILDLSSREWTKPDCKGIPPSPRESHTATLVSDDKLVIFGGSGEGDTNYLNDLHVLDLKTMRWTSPEVKGNVPVPRDSHTAVAVGNTVFVYGGDCGDRYEGDINMLDMDTLTWSRLVVQGSSPGVRAGHAAVNIGPKVYVIGGVGDKQYYNDVWVLDVSTCSWTQLEIRGQQPQGRFSHTAIFSETDIVIYGGCGEDEHPVNELIVLQLGAEHPNGRYNISLCKIFGNHCNQEKRRLSREARNKSQRTILLGNNGDVVGKKAREPELVSKQPLQINSDALHPKRKRTSNSKIWEIESEPEEHSLSLSQHSSPSQSDQEQTPVKKAAHSVIASQVFPLFKQQNQTPSNGHSNNAPSNQVNPKNFVQRSPQDFHFLKEHPNQPNSEQYLRVVHMGRHEAQYLATEQKPLEAGPFQNLVGAEIRGKIDGAFDSGYLMTATVNGRIFRGVLFAPGPEVVSRGATLGQNPSTLSSQRANVAQPCAPHVNHVSPTFIRHPRQPTTHSVPESGQNLRQAHIARPSPVIRAASSIGKEPKLRIDLQGVDLTLGSPGTGHGGS
ncbi:RING finger protein B-like isoform X1 [Camellia sinensis]|uniref:RING finger protein B-like isoform X1 n=1 Tax=Camellia sinensis TaxID=4442 RepID=UPI0010363AC6|nr:RING finger protein B-like isoform X1 [Camellia sinensis]